MRRSVSVLQYPLYMALLSRYFVRACLCLAWGSFRPDPIHPRLSGGFGRGVLTDLVFWVFWRITATKNSRGKGSSHEARPLHPKQQHRRGRRNESRSGGLGALLAPGTAAACHDGSGLPRSKQDGDGLPVQAPGLGYGLLCPVWAVCSRASDVIQEALQTVLGLAKETLSAIPPELQLETFKRKSRFSLARMLKRPSRK